MATDASFGFLQVRQAAFCTVLRSDNVPIQPCQHRPSGGPYRGDRCVRVGLLRSTQGQCQKQLRDGIYISVRKSTRFAVLSSALIGVANSKPGMRLEGGNHLAGPSRLFVSNKAVISPVSLSILCSDDMSTARSSLAEGRDARYNQTGR